MGNPPPLRRGGCRRECGGPSATYLVALGTGVLVVSCSAGIGAGSGADQSTESSVGAGVAAGGFILGGVLSLITSIEVVIDAKAMSKGRLIVICLSGGKFTTCNDGSWSYTGGDAHAIGVNGDTRFDELKSEMADMWKYNPDSVVIKYFLPNNNRTPVTISSDKDIQRMIEFHGDSATVDVYVLTGEDIISDVSTVPGSRSSRTTVPEPVTDADSPLRVADPLTDDDPFLPVVEPITPVGSPNSFAAVVWDSGQHKLTKSWENCITGVQQQFNSVHEFRDALSKYAIAHGFTYTLKKNESARVSAKCKAEGCPWRVYASRLSTTQLFLIKTMNGVHTCGAGTNAANRPQPSRKVVASIVKEKWRDSPNCTPKEIAEEIQQELGIELNYSQAWRGMETARKDIHCSFKDAYNQLPWLCEKMIETNPGSTATLTTREDGTFRGLFIAFYASLNGFRNGCRPLLFLDTLTLKSKYPSELVTAAALDGNDCFYPVAFAIVDIADDNNWDWFLAQLKLALSSSEPITFVTDRRMELRESIFNIFEDSFHGYCLHHLTEELANDLMGTHTQEFVRVILAHFFDAAYASTIEEYTKCLESIRNISSEAYQWLLQSQPQYWANALFEGSRYNHITSKFTESFYSWVSDLSMLPIVQIVDSIRRKMMELIYTRRVESNQWSTRLTPSIEDKLQKEVIKSQSLEVLPSPSGAFDIRDDMGAVNVVNMNQWGCSCGLWQITGFPCCHAVAVLGHVDGKIYDYCSKYFTIEIFRALYSESINPVPTADRPVSEDSSPVHLSKSGSSGSGRACSKIGMKLKIKWKFHATAGICYLLAAQAERAKVIQVNLGK
ncbi:hypothetical protein RJ640_021656 [Escallonia rubra]|uniref:SWIM-type domain-containing protein n=1 Tax=Escallonia rubra TaxID=112253 RepID=A0AA88QVR5_9ASTE|nr:hypothetical protein RJ640_021656 [Escallonia rubra]